MADDRTQRGEPDRSKINMNEAHEVRYWTQRFDVSRERLQQAVDKVGTGAAAIEKELAA